MTVSAQMTVPLHEGQWLLAKSWRFAHRPIVMAVVAFSSSPFGSRSGFFDKSPRMIAPAMMTVFPPSMILAFPSICARREILLPVS